MPVVLSPRGITPDFGSGTDADEIPWDEIQAVSAYRLDPVPGEVPAMAYLVFDLVYGEFFEIGDHDASFELLVSELPGYLPLLAEDLRQVVEGLPPGLEGVTLFQRGADY